MARRAASVPQPETEPDPAPNLVGSYPLAGQRVGPAWCEAWRVMGVGGWHSVRTMCFDVAPRHGLSPQALDAVVRTARAVPHGHPGRLETRVGEDRLLQVRRADRAEIATGIAPKHEEVPST